MYKHTYRHLERHFHWKPIFRNGARVGGGVRQSTNIYVHAHVYTAGQRTNICAHTHIQASGKPCSEMAPVLEEEFGKRPYIYTLAMYTYVCSYGIWALQWKWLSKLCIHMCVYIYGHMESHFHWSAHIYIHTYVYIAWQRTNKAIFRNGANAIYTYIVR